MLEMLTEYLLFLAKITTFVVAVLVVIGFTISVASRSKSRTKEGQIIIKKINEHYKEIERVLKKAMQTKHQAKITEKEYKKAEKREKEDKEASDRKRIFLIDFKGDIKASEVKSLREKITAILTVATPKDEVLARIESPGGLVYAYGLAASQLQRLRDRQIPLTVSVDKMAASGGYLMACIAHKIVAAPFAVVGSIGVIGQVPNFHRLLDKHDIEYEQHTAGAYKRTLTMFGKNTPEQREKFKEELQETHTLFKDFIHKNRPELDLQKVATGEHWYGQRAVELGLVDEIKTSDDYLFEASQESDIFEIDFEGKPTVSEKLSNFLRATTKKVFYDWWSETEKSRYQ